MKRDTSDKNRSTLRFDTHKVNPLHLIHKWSIEHPHIIIAFYVAVIAMAALVVTRVMPRRFAPYVQSPMVGVVTMMLFWAAAGGVVLVRDGFTTRTPQIPQDQVGRG